MRTVFRGVGILVVLLAVGVAAAWLNLDHIVRSEIEKEGTKSLRLSTTLDSARVALFGGKVGLHGLGIAQPRGFSGDKMLEAGDVDVAVSYHELRSHPIHVASLTLDKPKLVIEQSGGAVNFRKAMELLPASDPKKPPMKLVIDQLVVRDAQVVIHPGLPGVQREVVVRVPELTMKDVGRGAGAKNGAAIKEVTMRVITALAEKAAQSGEVPAQLKALLHLNAAEVAGKLGAEAAKRIGGALPGEAGKALEGLLPQGRAPERKR